MRVFLFTLLMVFASASFATPRHHQHSQRIIHHHQQIHHHHHHAPRHHHHRHKAPHHYRHHTHRHHHGQIIHRRYVRPCPQIIAVPPPCQSCAPIAGQVFLNHGSISLGFGF